MRFSSSLSISEKGSPTVGEEIATAILKKPFKGDVSAFTAIADRAEGKPAQPVEMNASLRTQLALVEGAVERVMQERDCARDTAIAGLSLYIPALRERGSAGLLTEGKD